MTTKKILNDAASVIEDYMTGLVLGSPLLARVEGWSIVVRSPETAKADDAVALVSGGGSGHEPAHAGYVGVGMLDAAVLGPVFTSPAVDAVYVAIRSVATSAGVLLIVKNYTGDRLNFGLAAEMARADGIRVEMVIVADDAALGDMSRAGRRGLTATVLVHKVAGAAAERGLPIERVAALANRLLADAATMGVALGSSIVPGATEATFELESEEVEWGLGIHGEAGAERGALVSSREIAATLVERLTQDLGLREGEDIVALVNSLGATPDLELRILHGDVLAQLAERGMRVRMTWSGPFLTSLEMPGASLTLARVDDELLDLLGEQAHVLAFPQRTPVLEPERTTMVASAHTFVIAPGTQPSPEGVQRLHEVAMAVADALLAAEAELTALDRQVGDGDLGTNLARGATACRNAADVLLTQPTASRYLTALSDIVRHEVGGTSGPLYSILLLTLAEGVKSAGAEPAANDWVDAAAAAVARVRAVGGAAPGDSTMIDALQPAIDALLAAPSPVDAATAARAGAESTAALRPALGRSSYVGARADGVADPGAVGIAVVFEAIRDALGRKTGSDGC